MISSMIKFWLFFSTVSVFTGATRAAEMENEILNLTAITWSHGTNSQQLLTTVLQSEIKMIEADIVFGFLIGDQSMLQQPIMAHPPLTESDITLADFLNQVLEYNKANPKEKQKGVKLDFKSTDVYQNSLPMLTDLWSKMDYPVWINADIFRGPLNNTATTPVDAEIFFEGTKNLTNAVLSTGWTTRWGADFREGNYTDDQVNEMIDGIKRSDIKNHITFPVRAGIAGQSITQLDHLYNSLNNSNPITFTIWSSENDFVNVENLREMIFHFGIDKIYIDVPEKLSSQLRLDVNSGFSLKPNVVMAVMLLLGFVLLAS